MSLCIRHRHRRRRPRRPLGPRKSRRPLESRRPRKPRRPLRGGNLPLAQHGRGRVGCNWVVTVAETRAEVVVVLDPFPRNWRRRMVLTKL
jgi:hypothetical protein